MKSLVLTIVLAIFNTALIIAYADELDLQLGEQDIALGYIKSEKNHALQTGLIYTEQNDHQDMMVTATLARIIENDEYLAALGIKAIASDPLAYYLNALAVDARLRYRPAAINDLSVQATLSLSNQAFTYADGNSLRYIAVNLAYDINRQMALAFGYRRINLHLINDIETDFDRGLYLGLLWHID